MYTIDLLHTVQCTLEQMVIVLLKRKFLLVTSSFEKMTKKKTKISKKIDTTHESEQLCKILIPRVPYRAEIENRLNGKTIAVRNTYLRYFLKTNELLLLQKLF